MTVIAANLREMAADTLVQLDGHPSYQTTKIFRLQDGSIVGGAGDNASLNIMLQWLRAGEIRGNEPDFTEMKLVDFTILRLKHDGLWIYTDCVYPDVVRADEFAVGAGAEVALYVMRHLKKPPKVAVREACKVNPHCGGDVDVLRL